MNKKPVDNQEYVLEADPSEVEKQIQEYKLKPDNHEDVNHAEDGSFKYTISSASCDLANVKGIIFGGISSRFWMLRKHMNSLDPIDYKRHPVPFYSWECLTLQLEHRDVDLVIRNEKDMEDFLIILIDGIKTVDGSRGSLMHIEKFIIKKKIEMNSTVKKNENV